MVRYIFFDLDGTLTDSSEGITKSFQYALSHFGLEENKKENLRRVMGPPLASSFREFYGFAEEDVAEAVRIFRQRYETKGLFENVPYEGVQEMLSILKERGYVLAIATCKPEHTAKRVLSHFALDSFFAVITGADDEAGRISKAAVIRETMKRLGLREQEKDAVLMVGDRFHDVEGAMETGIRCMGVSYGFAGKGELEKAGACYIADTTQDVAWHICYENAESYINEIPKFSKKTTHENIKKVLSILGSPQEQLQFIHVAGTNGKGSVCEFCASILKEAGYKTGLFISPHLVTMTERMRIDGSLISEKTFVLLYEKVMAAMQKLVKQGGVHLSFFEVLFVMAMVWFLEEHVDYVVLETGLGGRLDSTNVIPAPFVSVITSISLDHTEILGDTLEKIAFEKAGIIKSGTSLVYQANQKEVCKVMEETVCRRGILSDDVKKLQKQNLEILKSDGNAIDFCLHYGYYDKCTFTIPFPASYQVENAGLAVLAMELFGKKIGKPIAVSALKNGLLHSRWEARMEQILPDVYLDGGHNEDGITRFIEAAKQIKKDRDAILLFSVVKEKNFEKMVKNICDGIRFSAIIITDIAGERRQDINQLATCFQRYTDCEVFAIHDSAHAFRQALRMKKDRVLFCAGSLYLAGELKIELAAMRKNGELE